MKEHPILFSAPMVKAILENRKTQTRRVMCPENAPPSSEKLGYSEVDGLFSIRREVGGVPVVKEFHGYFCPHGRVGDRLWVRETWATSISNGAGQWHTIGVQKFLPAGGKIEYAATVKDGEHPPRWKSPMTMQRWASRITLEITDVRVQRLNDISVQDAEAEGVEWNQTPLRFGHTNPYSAFKSLWDSINGKCATWASNPWVWALTFKRVEGGA